MRQLADSPAVVLAWRNAGNVAVRVENHPQGPDGSEMCRSNGRPLGDLESEGLL